MRFQLEFPVIIDRYRSPDASPAWFTRRFPSLAYYLKILPIVCKASILAKRGLYDDPAWCRSSFDIFKAIEGVGIQCSIRNLKAVTELSSPFIVVGNHMSTLETFLLPYLICPHQKFTYIVKESLIRYPVFKHIMISRNPIVVGRRSAKEDFVRVMKEGTKRIEAGYSLAVFPQTTRMTQFDPARFNSIGVKLAKRAGVPIIPLALKTDAWGTSKWFKDFGKVRPRLDVHMAFGNSLPITSIGREEQKAIISHIEQNLRKWTTEKTSGPEF
ncbi:MAG: 1-acyl-sn-glycerol-3-phosphate acyltransferase [Opitutae bacterium]|nr:1-acyl-sn-glycerol-3-phosphate acyltransferase [Opitutae bacterium]